MFSGPSPEGAAHMALLLGHELLHEVVTMNGNMEVWKCGWMDGWMDGWMVCTIYWSMLPCLLQVVLDNTQIAAVILSQDLMWHLPDWAVHALSGMLMTQASTWQWVPFDCLLPDSSAASAAAVQAVLVMLLPSELCQRTADAC